MPVKGRGTWYFTATVSKQELWTVGQAGFPGQLGLSPDKQPGTVKSKNDAGLFHQLLGKVGNQFNMALELGRISKDDWLRL